MKKIPLNSIDGATALKLDEQLEMDTTPSMYKSIFFQRHKENIENINVSSPHGISLKMLLILKII